jgi:hypothetical protein
MDKINLRHKYVLNHLQRYFKIVNNLSLKEIIGTLMIHIIPNTPERDYIILATSGANIRNPKENYELLMYLPSDWNLSYLENNPNSWPVEWIRKIAYYENTISPENTFSNEESFEPLAPNTQLSGFIILPELNDYGKIKLQNGETISFLNLIPLYKEEIELKKKMGTKELLERFYNNGINMIINMARKNVGNL